MGREIYYLVQFHRKFETGVFQNMQIHFHSPVLIAISRWNRTRYRDSASAYRIFLPSRISSRSAFDLAFRSLSFFLSFPRERAPAKKKSAAMFRAKVIIRSIESSFKGSGKRVLYIMQASEVNRAEYFTFARVLENGAEFPSARVRPPRISRRACHSVRPPVIDASLISLLKPGDLAATNGGHIRV